MKQAIHVATIVERFEKAVSIKTVRHPLSLSANVFSLTLTKKDMAKAGTVSLGKILASNVCVSQLYKVSPMCSIRVPNRHR